MNKLVPGIYDDKSRRCSQLAGGLVDKLHDHGRITEDQAQLLFDRMVDMFLTFSEQELALMEVENYRRPMDLV